MLGQPSGLTDEDIAAHFLSFGGGIFSVGHLIKWLDRMGLGHRNAAQIAEAVNRIQAEAEQNTKPEPLRQPLPSPEQNAWDTDQAEGWGNPRDLYARTELANFLVAN
jgi:hypothetical protein